MKRERVRLTLETAPSDVPAAVRLKRLMKALGRWYGWKCVAIEEVKVDGPGPVQELRHADRLDHHGERPSDSV